MNADWKLELKRKKILKIIMYAFKVNHTYIHTYIRFSVKFI